MTALEGRELWFAAGAQDLYGPEVLRTVAEHGREVAAALDASPDIPTQVRDRGVVVSHESIRRLCLDASADDTCVGLVVWMHTFSPAKMWIAGLSALQKPLLHLHTQFNRELPWAEIDMDFMNLNQSAHGDRELASLETRMGIRRKTVVGHWSDSRVRRRIGTWARAACGWHELQRLSIARFGDNMRQVAVTEGDKVEAQIRLGVAVNGYGVGELARMVGEVSDAEADAVVARLRRAIRRRAGPACGRRAARVAARRRADRDRAARASSPHGGFGAFTDTFEDLGDLPQLPGIAVQRLMADGYGFGAEGDWKTAALLRAAKVMAVGLPGGTSFMEDYTYDLAPGGRPRARRAHARGLPVARSRPAVVRGASAVDRWSRTTRSGSSSPRAPGRR